MNHPQLSSAQRLELLDSIGASDEVTNQIYADDFFEMITYKPQTANDVRRVQELLRQKGFSPSSVEGFLSEPEWREQRERKLGEGKDFRTYEDYAHYFIRRAIAQQ